jgi:DNA-binding beta-propeller fold protein YncE
MGGAFDQPQSVTSDGTHVWVANLVGNSVTELSASTGALIKVIRGSICGFSEVEGIATGGTHVWVANLGGNSVTELSASTGALVRVIGGSS